MAMLVPAAVTPGIGTAGPLPRAPAALHRAGACGEARLQCSQALDFHRWIEVGSEAREVVRAEELGAERYAPLCSQMARAAMLALGAVAAFKCGGDAPSELTPSPFFSLLRSGA